MVSIDLHLSLLEFVLTFAPRTGNAFKTASNKWFKNPFVDEKQVFWKVATIQSQSV